MLADAVSSEVAPEPSPLAAALSCVDIDDAPCEICAMTALQQAFLEIASQKALQKITVSELVTASGVSRGTFYTHYRDVFDLAEKIGDNLIRRLDAEMELALNACIDTESYPMIDDALRFIAAHETEARLFLVNQIEPTFGAKVNNLVGRSIVAAIAQQFGTLNKPDRQLVTAYIAAGILGIIRSLISCGCKPDANGLSHTIGVLATQGVSGLAQQTGRIRRMGLARRQRGRGQTRRRTITRGMKRCPLFQGNKDQMTTNGDKPSGLRSQAGQS